jgi:hypothetical protein
MFTAHWLKIFLQSIIYLTLVVLLLREVNEATAIEECTGFDAPARALKRSDYDLLIRYGTPEERSNRRVVKVVLSPATEPDNVISNLCLQREFTARVINRLNQLGAAVIALDKIYKTDRCADEDPGTKDLRDAVAGSRAKITRGLFTEIVPETRIMDQKFCLVLQGNSNLPLGVAPERTGLLRMDANTSLVPLAWLVHLIDKNNKIDTVKELLTLSFVTAQAAEPQTVQTRRLKRALRNHQQPYSTRTSIPEWSALQLLCGRSAGKTTDWRTCDSSERPPELSDAVAIFGDHYGDDRHPDPHSPNGIYGVDLQADYVAAILDKRYYMPLLSPTEEYFFVASALVLLHFCFYLFQKRFWRIFWIALGAWALIVVISFVIVSFTGRLFTVWMQGFALTTIFVTALHHWNTSGRTSSRAGVELADKFPSIRN